MIFGNINSIEEFPFLEEEIKECFEYAKTHDLASFEYCGIHNNKC